MIFGKRSDEELKLAKAIAKTTEFSATTHPTPDFDMNPDELHYTSILTLSTYVNARLSGSAQLGQHLSDLQKTGSFYDAASND